MAKRRNIVVVTGTRAEFGLLAPVMRAIAEHPRLRLRTVVTGTHLTTGTWRDIPAGGFEIDLKVPMQRRGAIGRQADVTALSRGIAGLGAAFARSKADVVLVLGDRIEPLAAACAAHVGGIHLAHIHGGDRAEGVADEAMRHAISKLAHLHFAATAQSRQRLIRMGEAPEFVFHVGSPSIDGLRGIEPADDALLHEFGLQPDEAFVMLAQHPIGAPDNQEKRWMIETIRAAQAWPMLVFYPNHDPGSQGISEAVRRIVWEPISHLPREIFASLLARAGAIVGNSSAGLIEAAALKTPCVNIGPRQAGREKLNNVVDCEYGKYAVHAAINRALGMDRSRIRHPYGDGRAGQRIAQVLARLDLDRQSLRKRNAY